MRKLILLMLVVMISGCESSKKKCYKYTLYFDTYVSSASDYREEGDWIFFKTKSGSTQRSRLSKLSSITENKCFENKLTDGSDK